MINAAYNIGARYFVRELLKTLPATEEQRIRAKVPGCDKRGTCSLSTLISLVPKERGRKAVAPRKGE